MGNSDQGLVNMTFLLPSVVPFGVYEVKKKSQGRIYVCSHIIKDVTLIYFYSKWNSIPGGISSDTGPEGFYLSF